MKKFVTILVFICIFGAFVGCSSKPISKKETKPSTTITESTTNAHENTTTPIETTNPIEKSTQKTTEKPKQSSVSKVTIGEINALESAKSYLRYSAFSSEGLADQLDYEGYTTSEIEYALKNCGADWYEQAEKSAESYLKYSSFSYDGLVDQLEYEGFTHEQAVHGADKAYGDSSNSNNNNAGSAEKKNALDSAKSYLRYSAFSYIGLIDQLEYEGYSTEACQYAVDNCGADWYEQAKECAKSYLSFSSFSRSELIDQLEYEGFTYDQAVYGAEQNGY